MSGPRRLGLAIVVVLALIAVAVSLPLILEGGEPRLRIATTTSLYNTGLLDYLIDSYKEERRDIVAQVIAVGSGEALERAKRGDACLVFSHAPKLEREYLEAGYITGGFIVAYNYFVIVGPASDPAGVRSASSPVEAFRSIWMAGERGEARFVSRGDRSGTHVKELELWEKAGVEPGGEWYIVSGQGMSATLILAEELDAYTLSDIGTFLMLKSEGRVPHLEDLYSGGDELLNIYSIYYSSKCTGGERRLAEDFTRFVVDNQDLIERYGLEKYGKPLFYKAEDKMEWLRAKWREQASG